MILIEPLPKREKKLAKSIGWLLLVVILAWLWCSVAQGAAHDAAVCRIINQMGQGSDIGSGTLIDKTEDGREGLVLTCAHLFREGRGKVQVTFSNGQQHMARVVDVDSRADLAALAIASPTVEPAKVAIEQEFPGKLTACGFGPAGVYRCVAGTKRGMFEAPGQTSLMIDGVVRSGDSGGGVFDSQGRLVAVIWGADRQGTYVSVGEPLKRFLDRVLIRRKTFRYYGSQCPPGQVCRPQQQPNQFVPQWRPVQRQPVVPARPANIQPPAQSGGTCKCIERFTLIEQRIAALEAREPQRGPPGQDGKAGRDGKDAVLGHDQIEMIVQQIATNIENNQSQTVNYKELAAEIVRQSTVLVDAVPSK